KSSRASGGRSWIPAAVCGDGKSIVISAKTSRSGPASSRVARVRLPLSTHTRTPESQIDVKPFKVRLRFHGDLNPFVESNTGVAVIERQLAEKTSIKDIIESCGVPHPEVDLILVDDQTVGFDYTLARDAKVEVFSVENYDTDYTEKRLQTIGIKRFVSD